MIGIAMLSFAHVHANGYAQRVVDNPNTEIRCIWDDDPERGHAASQRFDAPWTPDIEAALSRPDIDAVVVNSTTKDHPWVLKAALAHNKHVYTEKALTIGLADAEEIVAEAHRAGCKFMISLPQRTSPETLFMRHVLDQGWLGQVTLMRARIAHAGGLDKWFKGGSAWFADADLAGGGAMFDLGCHIVDIMRWFMGPPKSVVAKINNLTNAYPIDDNSAVVVEFESGALGVLECSWAQRRGPRPMEIYGTDGYVGRDPFGGVILASAALDPRGVQGLIRVEKLPEAQPHPVDQWVSAMLHDTPMTITVEDGRNLTELMAGMYVASREGREYRF
jgi:predicted dehydrogenase